MSTGTWLNAVLYHLNGFGGECENTGVKTPGAAVLTLHSSLTQSSRPAKSHFLLVLKWELLQLLEGDEELRRVLRKTSLGAAVAQNWVITVDTLHGLKRFIYSLVIIVTFFFTVFLFFSPEETAGFKGYDDVPRPQSQPVWPESLIESEEALVLPRLHHSIQCSFVHGASWQDSLVHHTSPDHIYRVGGQCPGQATCETGTVTHMQTWTRLTNQDKAVSKLLLF